MLNNLRIAGWNLASWSRSSGVLANRYGRHVLVFFWIRQIWVIAFEWFYGSYVCSKKSSETLPLCPKRRDHSIMKNMMMLQHITRIHHQRNYWLLYLLTIYCWYNQLFHHKLDSVSYYASPETGCYHPVVDCVYSLIVVFLYRVDNGKTFFTWLLLFKLVLVMLFGATRTEASLKRLAVRGLQQAAACSNNLVLDNPTTESLTAIASLMCS